MSDFKYTIKRSSRRTIGVSILNDNSIIVKCPYSIRVGEIEKFLEKKESWIKLHTERNNVKIAYLRDVINLKKILIKGEFAELEICNENYFSKELIKVKNIKNLKSLFVKNLGGEFVERLNEISYLSGLKYSKVAFKDYKSRWGCCSKSGELTFNYKLLMLPDSIRDYVIVHELCHTVHMDHSAKFYELVRSIYPDYKKALSDLKTYSAITRLY